MSEKQENTVWGVFFLYIQGGEFWNVCSEVSESPEVIYTSSEIPQTFGGEISQQHPSWFALSNLYKECLVLV